MKRILFLSFSLLISINLGSQSSYEIVCATDFDGEVISGSIDSLIHLIRQGKPARVGWQLDFNGDKEADFDHWVDAEFITILGGHVFTQIETIYIQGPNASKPQVEIYPISDQWTAVVGTNGKLLNRFIRTEPPKIALKDPDSPEAQALKKEVADMTKVQTWKVATFWSVQR